MPEASRSSAERLAAGDPRALPSESAGRVGIVLIGHGDSASALLSAARAISPEGAFDGIVAVDAGAGRTPELDRLVCEAVDSVAEGRGVLLLVDLFGSSPCACGLAHRDDRAVAVVSGLNLAMLVKLASLERAALDLESLAEACADTAKRAVLIRMEDPRRELAKGEVP